MRNDNPAGHGRDCPCHECHEQRVVRIGRYALLLFAIIVVTNACFSCWQP